VDEELLEGVHRQHITGNTAFLAGRSLLRLTPYGVILQGREEARACRKQLIELNLIFCFPQVE
jgi:hypothetical protein